MERYKNLSGDSGVVAYEIGSDFIRVQFSDGAVYLYNYTSAGLHNIDHMKQLARNGQGPPSSTQLSVRHMLAKSVKLSI